MRPSIISHTRLARFAISLVAVALCLALCSCAAVRGRRAIPDPSGFLGDYSQLAPREGFEERLVQIDETADWSRYSAIHVDSVTLWANREQEKLPPQEQQMLTDVMYAQLVAALDAKSLLAERPGPGVLRLRAAITQAKGAKVPLRAITSILPPAFLVSTAAGLSTDTAATVGTATLEAELVDSITNRRLAATVDSRAGTKSILAGARTFQKWGDYEAACAFWADRLIVFLERQGVRATTESRGS